VDPVYEALVKFKPGTAEIIPMLATSWDASRDGLSYTFQLRQGVRFHDGATFNSKTGDESATSAISIMRG
jgi:peptide/nickel transport system substrate-binding protein